MAVTSTTLDITLVDTFNYEVTYKIDNPKSGLTRASVTSAFSTMLNDSDTFVSSYGYPFANISKIVKTNVEKEEL